MSSIWDIANEQLRDLAVYEPGTPIEETARELGADADKIIKLASNENPLGPSPKALAAMHAALDCAHLYPDGGGFYLCEALAARLGFTREHLILGSGSNEIIEFFGHAFLNRGDDVITSEHAFIAYKLVAAVFGARTIEVPSPDLRHDLDVPVIEVVRARLLGQARHLFLAEAVRRLDDAGGRHPGRAGVHLGLAVGTVYGCAIFGACSGSSLACWSRMTRCRKRLRGRWPKVP